MKKMALLQNFSETALEYRTFADSWLAFEQNGIKIFDAYSDRVLDIYATLLPILAQMQKHRSVFS